jgi:hypothetical protein
MDRGSVKRSSVLPEWGARDLPPHFSQSYKSVRSGLLAFEIEHCRPALQTPE